MESQLEKNAAWLETFYGNLQSLVDTAFPKTCPKCGKVFKDSHAFLMETIPVKDLTLSDRSGLFPLDGMGTAAAVGVFRNCTCGTTIMANFHDRRDLTEAGNERRARFDALVNMLCERGLNADTARDELRGLLRGEESPGVRRLIGEVSLP